MLQEMFSGELAQADLKAIGKSRGFDAETTASRELMQHVFLSDQGVPAALAGLTEPELLTLHLLNCLGDEVDLEFFKRLYPEAVASKAYYISFTERYKPLFQQVKVQLVRRGVLLYGTLPEGFSKLAMLERRRFRFPVAFASFLPPPFRPKPLAPPVVGQFRQEVLRNKILEIPQAGLASATPSRNEEGRWRLVNGELLFGGEPFGEKQLRNWPLAQFQAALGYTARNQPAALQPIPLFQYALSRLGENEWLAPGDLAPLWNLALPGAKAPDAHTVCETAFHWGCVEKTELQGTLLYRPPPNAATETATPPEAFLDIQNPQEVGVRLESIPWPALDRLCEISRLDIIDGRLLATPNFLKLSHAALETLENPTVVWLRHHHPAFGATMASVEQKRGKLLVHENLLVARVSDLGLKVMLEKKFGAPGRLISLSREFLAFPQGLLPEIQSWMKKSGHVIKTQKAGE